MEWSTILYAVIFSAAYVGFGLFKTTDEPFNMPKAIASMIIGGFIGLVLALAGQEVTQEAVLAQFAMFEGMVYVVENIIKGILRRLGYEYLMGAKG